MVCRAELLVVWSFSFRKLPILLRLYVLRALSWFDAAFLSEWPLVVIGILMIVDIIRIYLFMLVNNNK